MPSVATVVAAGGLRGTALAGVGGGATGANIGTGGAGCGIALATAAGGGAGVSAGRGTAAKAGAGGGGRAASGSGTERTSGICRSELSGPGSGGSPAARRPDWAAFGAVLAGGDAAGAAASAVAGIAA